jgi:PAS domain S-box-containing protein
LPETPLHAPHWATDAARIETDVEGRIVAWNGAAEALYGYQSQEALGRPVVSFIVPGRGRQQATAIMEALALGRSWEGEFDVRHRDGHLLRVLVHDTPTYDANGHPVGFVGYSIAASRSVALPQPAPPPSTAGSWAGSLRVAMFDPTVRVGRRTRVQLILAGLALQIGWDMVVRAGSWDQSTGIVGAIAIVGVLAIAIADLTAGVIVALLSGIAFVAIVAETETASTRPAFSVTLVAVWVAAAVAVGVAAVGLRRQAQRGIDDAVALHRQLAASLVPSPRLNRVDVSVAAAHRPGEQRLALGGDFFAAMERADGTIALLVGDVSGHGPVAAGLAARLRAGWEALVEADVAPPVRLQALNRVLLDHARSEEFFATVASVVITPALTEATITLAGHPPPILKHRGSLVELDLAAGMPLGVSDVATWTPTVIALPEAFSLLLYTDGVIEGRVASRPGERFGEKRLTDVFVATTATGRELVEELLAAAVHEHGGQLPDDAALVLLEHDARLRSTGHDPSRHRNAELPTS